MLSSQNRDAGSVALARRCRMKARRFELDIHQPGPSGAGRRERLRHRMAVLGTAGLVALAHLRAETRLLPQRGD